jgi:uncharacterized protein (TIGR02452 family)
MNKVARANIAKDNKKVVSQLLRLGQQIPRTKVIDFNTLRDEDVEPVPIEAATSVELQDLKTDECAKLYFEMDHPDYMSDPNDDPLTESNIAIMNFASRKHCGGGYVRGARAQEEDLCRTIPLLYSSMVKISYPLGETTVWITPYVNIMRSSDNYSLLNIKKQVPVTVVSAAAPALSRNREKWDENRVRNTLINLFVSVKKECPKVDTLILGAFGCGAYGNDPYEIARIMNEVCQEYGGLYSRIVVSIPWGRDGNYDAFASTMDSFDAC